MSTTVRIDRLTLPIRIGILDHERTGPQTVEISIAMAVRDGLLPDDYVSYAPVVEHLIALSESGRHIDLVEDLTDEIFAFLFADDRIAEATVTVMKPDIFTQAGGVGVTVTRANR